MISMPAAGLTGALKNVRTYGMSLSSITGLDSITGYPEGQPIPMENAFADPLGGVIGAFAALSASTTASVRGAASISIFPSRKA